MIKIGNWVQRLRTASGVRASQWHEVESLIEDRVITQCGRQMRRQTKTGSLEVSETKPDDILWECGNCSR